MRFKLIDSLAFNTKEPPWNFERKVEFDKKHEKYPRMVIENRCYFSRAFRKIHIEVVYR